MRSITKLRMMALGGIATGTMYAYIRQQHDKIMTLYYMPTEQNKIIVDDLKTVLSQYHPTFYLPFNLFRMLVNYPTLPDSKHLERQNVQLPDGEMISMDWLPKSFASMDESTPIVLLVPGLTGDCTSGYANKFVNYAVHDHGFRACIMNR